MSEPDASKRAVPPWIADEAAARERARRLLDEPLDAVPGDFRKFAERFLSKHRDRLLEFLRHRPTPCYVFDVAETRRALRRFRRLFDAAVPRHTAFYAVKSNPYSGLLREAVRAGYGLDVSSPRELRMARRAGAKSLVFSGPAKTDADLLEFFADGDEPVRIVMLDSFRELRRLAAILPRLPSPPRAGVRLFTPVHGAWSKFGVSIDEVGPFFAEARRLGVRLEGVQVHLSWNRSPDPYVRIIRLLGETLPKALSAEDVAGLRFLDLGGGYKPHALEGSFLQDAPLGAVLQTANDSYDEETRFLWPHCRKPSTPLAKYAAAVGASLREWVLPWFQGECFTEPGRIVSTFSMHLALRVADKKRPDLAILDGGINMVGWEKYLHIYAPVINLTHPASEESPVQLGGSLCDPEDMWGGRCFAEKVEEGDLLVVPFQGAYTYGVAQDFIRPIPPVYQLK